MSLCRRSGTPFKQKGEEVVKVAWDALDNRINFFQLLGQPLEPVAWRRTHRPSGAVRGSGPSCDPEGGVGNRSSGHGYLHTRRPDYQPPSLICSTGEQPRLAQIPSSGALAD